MTKMKTILAAAALVAAPGLASAQCNWGKMEQQVTMSCAPGTTWDATAGTCVPEATS
ncbi:adenylosuccinate lyase [Jannaschia formosa]|uniref:adenylosuccinate lyase n=1 Tax=Jannaschia formosa TaxID=2259592 RepID=UPI000E1C1CF2|nr:adenylosuccinate lyase [Jannaschia formosa]TFL17885.1 adenylosuccinate lyase [Jannaschia formosa]